MEPAFEYMCVEKNYGGTEELDINFATLIASRWVTRINLVCKVIELEASTNFCDTCREEACMDTITQDHPMLTPIM